MIPEYVIVNLATQRNWIAGPKEARIYAALPADYAVVRRGASCLLSLMPEEI